MKITREHVDNAILMETNRDQFLADASSLGFPPGRYPLRIETTLGNKRSFVLISHDGGGAKYRQFLGCTTLTVFND